MRFAQPSLAGDTVYVEYQGRQRNLPTPITPTGQSQNSYYGNPLVGFWMPNWYATPKGAFTFYLQEAALQALQRVQQDLVNQDMSLLLVDAYRTYEKQMEAYQSKPGLAIHPDQSKHTKGLAVDIRISGGSQADLENAMARYGWKRTVPNEPWHFDYVGGGIDTTNAPGSGPSGNGGSVSGMLLLAGVGILGIGAAVWYFGFRK